MIQHGSGKRGRLSVKNEARKTTAIRGYVIRKDSKLEFEEWKSDRADIIITLLSRSSVIKIYPKANQRAEPQTRFGSLSNADLLLTLFQIRRKGYHRH